MLRSSLRRPLLAALLLVLAPAFATASPLNPGLSERLQAFSADARADALQEVIHLSMHSPAELDAPGLMPVLFEIAENDESPQLRVMASQAIAKLGTRADIHKLSRIARRDSSTWARRQMQIAAASAGAH
jgi:hypothetical protein